ncbi:MAG: hypothetical protein O2968_23920 [Acidobacteria bacterium]|nr:hypothetical protein [Acidobacteriota bacterium]
MSKRKRPVPAPVEEHSTDERNQGEVNRRLQPNPVLTEEQQLLVGLTNAIQRKGSFEDLLLDSGLTQPEELVEFAGMRKAILSAIIRTRLVKPLSDDERWQDLSDQPPDFDRALQAVFGNFTMLMKSLYGIKSHRPPAQRKRNREIWQMRQRDHTFGKIARKFGINAKTAERACNRHRQHRETETKDILQMLADCLAESGPPFSKSSPPNPSSPYLM